MKRYPLDHPCSPLLKQGGDREVPLLMTYYGEFDISEITNSGSILHSTHQKS